MGSGKKNYRALRASTRQWRPHKKTIEERKDPPQKEDVDNFLEMWKKQKEKNANS